MSEEARARLTALMYIPLFAAVGTVASYLLENKPFGVPFVLGIAIGIFLGGAFFVFPITRSRAEGQRERRRRDRRKHGGLGWIGIMFGALIAFIVLSLILSAAGGLS